MEVVGDKINLGGVEQMYACIDMSTLPLNAAWVAQDRVRSREAELTAEARLLQDKYGLLEPTSTYETQNVPPDAAAKIVELREGAAILRILDSKLTRASSKAELDEAV